MKMVFMISVVFGFAIASVGCGQAALPVPSVAYPTIQSALNGAATNDVVVVAPGTYFENLIWPATECGLQGAGVGQTIIDGNNSGACIVFNNAVNSSFVDGFTFTNGSGALVTNGIGLVPMGGAIHINRTSTAPSTILTPIIRNCRFTNNSADNGGAVSIRFAGLTLENCDFDNNTLNFVWGYGAAMFLQPQPWNVVNIRGCTFSQHTQGIVCEWDTSATSSSIEVSDCIFEQNTGVGIIKAPGGVMSFERNRFIQNVCTGRLFEVYQLGNPQLIPFVIESCVFANNTASRLIWTSSSVNFGTGLLFTNNTIVGNMTTDAPISMGGGTLFTDSILLANVKPNGVPYGMPIRFPINNMNLGFSAEYSNIQGGNVTGPGVVTIAAQFVDGLNGDYRLVPGSPMIDAGATNPIFARGSMDVRGLPRVHNGTVDMGAFEAQGLVLHPASAGRVGENAGGPYDVLTINGSKGNALREIEVSIGASVSLEMEQPPHLSTPLNFSIFGFLGEANFDSVVNVPLGIGDMMFTPAPMFPFLHPNFFTMASTVGQLGFYAPLFSATPTPWISGPGPAIPIPLLLTLQGVIEESPGVFVPTNALIFEVK